MNNGIETEKFYWINTLCVLDALDKNASDICYFPEGTTEYIDRYVFNNAAIGEAPIFRIKGYEVGGILVNDVFRRLVENCHLAGLVWKELA